MINAYNERITSGVLPSTCSPAVQGNLLAEKPYIINAEGEQDTTLITDPKFNDFDLCIVGLGFHHFDDYVGSLRKLSERVKKGGLVGIVDLYPNAEVCALDLNLSPR